MFYKFFTGMLCMLLAFNICRISFHPEFWDMSELERQDNISYAANIFDTFDDFSSDWEVLVYDVSYMQRRLILAWNGGFASGFSKLFSQFFPDLLRVFIDVINSILNAFNLVLNLCGLPSIPDIPVWDRDPIYSDPGFGGGGGGARGLVRPFLLGVSPCERDGYCLCP